MARSAPIARTVMGLLLAAAIGIGACGGSANPAYCEDRAALEQSLTDLGNVDVRTQGVEALEARLKEVQSDANALARSAQDEFGPEASALKSAVATLEAAVQRAIAAPSAQSVSDVAAGVSSVTAAFGRLSDAVSSHC
jgi:hypothetical protein